MTTRAKSKHHGKPKQRKTDARQQSHLETKHRSEVDRAQTLARLVRETRARAEEQATREAQENARPAREVVKARRPESDLDPVGKLMVDALCRGCGVTRHPRAGRDAERRFRRSATSRTATGRAALRARPASARGRRRREVPARYDTHAGVPGSADRGPAA